MKIFLTKVGYIFGWISIALFVFAVWHRLTYEPGWFIDMSDFGFLLFGQPLLSLVNFDINYADTFTGIMLWVLTALNLIIITYIVDAISFALIKVYKMIVKVRKN